MPTFSLSDRAALRQSDDCKTCTHRGGKKKKKKRLGQVFGDMFHLKKTRLHLIKASDEGMNIRTKNCTLSEGNELAYATSPSKYITTSVSACITKQYAQ